MNMLYKDNEFREHISEYYYWSINYEYVPLSLDTLREFKDKVNWALILIQQKLPLEFIEEMKDYIDFDNQAFDLYGTQNLTRSFCEKYIESFDRLGTLIENLKD